MHGHDIKAYERKFKAFGWDTISIDGHKIPEILKALQKARENKNPTAILARTIKGKGVSFVEDRNGWHGKPLKADEMKRALEELGPMPPVDSKKYVKKPRKSTTLQLKKDSISKELSTRKRWPHVGLTGMRWRNWGRSTRLSWPLTEM